MGRELKASREDILAIINTNSFFVRSLWEEVFNEKIDDVKWNEIQSLVKDKMRQ